MASANSSFRPINVNSGGTFQKSDANTLRVMGTQNKQQGSRFKNPWTPKKRNRKTHSSLARNSSSTETTNPLSSLATDLKQSRPDSFEDNGASLLGHQRGTKMDLKKFRYQPEYDEREYSFNIDASPCFVSYRGEPTNSENELQTPQRTRDDNCILARGPSNRAGRGNDLLLDSYKHSPSCLSRPILPMEKAGRLEYQDSDSEMESDIDELERALLYAEANAQQEIAQGKTEHEGPERGTCDTSSAVASNEHKHSLGSPTKDKDGAWPKNNPDESNHFVSSAIWMEASPLANHIAFTDQQKSRKVDLRVPRDASQKPGEQRSSAFCSADNWTSTLPGSTNWAHSISQAQGPKLRWNAPRDFSAIVSSPPLGLKPSQTILGLSKVRESEALPAKSYRAGGSAMTRDKQANAPALEPFVRGAVPGIIIERPHIKTVSSATCLRVCFRIGEAIRAASIAQQECQEIIVELYASALETSYNEGSQHFKLGDLFMPHNPPFLEAQWKGLESSQLWKEDIQQLSSGGEALVRILGRMQPGPKWKLAVMSAFEVTWDEVKMVKEIIQRLND